MRQPLDFEGALDCRKEKHRLSRSARATELHLGRFSFERKIQIQFCGGATERAQLDSLSHRNVLPQLSGGEEQFFRRKGDVVSLIDLAITLGQTLVELTHVRLDTRRFVDNQYRIAEMFEDV